MCDLKMAVRFYSVTDGMAQVQLLARTIIKLILLHHIPFQTDTSCNHAFPVKIGSGLLKITNHIRVIEHTILDNFRAAIQKQCLRQGVQSGDITQHQLWLLKRTNEIFTCGKVNGGFSTHRGIHHSQQGSGNLNVRNAPQKRGCRKTRDIAGDTAA